MKDAHDCRREELAIDFLSKVCYNGRIGAYILFLIGDDGRVVKTLGDLTVSQYKVVISFKEFFEQHQRPPFRREFGTEGLFEYDYVRERFPCYYDVLKLAGIRRGRPTREELILAVRYFYAEYGRTPTQIEAKEGLLIYSLGTFLRQFGSWNELIVAAGYRPRIRYRWGRLISRRYLIVRLQRKTRQIGRIPTTADIIRDPDMPPMEYYAQEIGDWATVCRIARLADVLREIETECRREMLIYLQGVAGALGRTPTKTELDAVADAKHKSAIYVRMFDGWFNALALAGLKVQRKSRAKSFKVKIEQTTNRLEDGEQIAHDVYFNRYDVNELGGNDVDAKDRVVPFVREKAG